MGDSSGFLDSAAKQLPVRFSIYLPGEVSGEEKEGSPDSIIRSAKALMCERFGGVTGFAAAGLFKKNSGVMQEERVLVLESFCDVEAWEGLKELLYVLAGVLAACLEQENIACSINGRMHLVGPNPRARNFRRPTGQLMEVAEIAEVLLEDSR